MICTVATSNFYSFVLTDTLLNSSMQYYSEKYPLYYCNIPSLQVAATLFNSLHLQGICKPGGASLRLPRHTYSPHGGCNGKNAAGAAAAQITPAVASLQMQCLAGLAAVPRATFSHSIRVAKILLAEPEAAAHICLSMWLRCPALPTPCTPHALVPCSRFRANVVAYVAACDAVVSVCVCVLSLFGRCHCLIVSCVIA